MNTRSKKHRAINNATNKRGRKSDEKTFEKSTDTGPPAAKKIRRKGHKSVELASTTERTNLLDNHILSSIFRPRYTKFEDSLRVEKVSKSFRSACFNLYKSLKVLDISRLYGYK